ncbi:hypothetical protein [Pseudomonas monteilii]|uniref:hypothetical protein n=1 Tax=Pseudomonas monteilii TaxID=76759 RepID=UPI001CBE16C4|nr:hypothetical protein [Pseudomonas monteilii]MBZ3666283.1 hypothetical protein [Pseudomonas monteilii]MBZ3671627.1 hypothetical protein [Pseudomonas monteilii]
MNKLSERMTENPSPSMIDPADREVQINEIRRRLQDLETRFADEVSVRIVADSAIEERVSRLEALLRPQP